MPHVSKQLLLGVLYHEASPKEAQRAQQHLAECASCRDYFEEAQRLAARLSQWPEQKPLPDTFARILVTLPRTQPRRLRRAFSFKPIFGIACALLLLTIALYFVQNRISALALWNTYEQHWLIQALGSYGVVALLFLGLAAFFTLAFAPVLYFNVNKRTLYL